MKYNVRKWRNSLFESVQFRKTLMYFVTTKVRFCAGCLKMRLLHQLNVLFYWYVSLFLGLCCVFPCRHLPIMAVTTGIFASKMYWSVADMPMRFWSLGVWRSNKQITQSINQSNTQVWLSRPTCCLLSIMARASAISFWLTPHRLATFFSHLWWTFMLHSDREAGGAVQCDEMVMRYYCTLMWLKSWIWIQFRQTFISWRGREMGIL